MRAVPSPPLSANSPKMYGERDHLWRMISLRIAAQHMMKTEIFSTTRQHQIVLRQNWQVQYSKSLHFQLGYENGPDCRQHFVLMDRPTV